ncbi:hypothetical protein LIER_08524 [Lithospermum erythrorhizon]|uniref:PB1 domain-containing protein n=1 Tax=Lithospermum erythrorhizon TaxID=34254 RepID=A0AAV3PDG4_LITER
MDPPPSSTPPPPTTTAAPPVPPPETTTPTTADDPPTTSKLRLMCSYNGHIIPRPTDKSLCYIGGDTRIIVVERHTPFAEFKKNLSKTIFKNKPFTLKYQLPNEDLDSLISISNDDDFENMVDEYDRLNNNLLSYKSKALKTSRLRLFLFHDQHFGSESSIYSIDSLLESSNKSEDWFLEALNGGISGVNVASNNSASVYSESNSSVNCLLGLDEVVQKQNQHVGLDRDGSNECLVMKNRENDDHDNIGTDVQDVDDSLVLDKGSSFGSGSSLNAMANLPPIKVHLEEKGGGRVGASPPSVIGPVVGGGGGGEYVNRVVSDDERSDQGVPVGYRMVQQVQHQVQPQQHFQQPAQFQQKAAGFVDLPSPNSVSSDGSVTNPLPRQRQMVYQEQIMHMQSGNRGGANVVVVDQKMNDLNNRGQMKQPIQESEYVMPGMYEQHPQLHQQQFVHAGMQYVHSHTGGGVPIASYYPLYHSQQQHHPHHQGSEQQFVYYVNPASRPAQAYNMQVQQQSYGESPSTAQPSRSQTPPHPTSLVNPGAAYNALNVPASKPEMAAGVYRTSATGAPQLVQMQPSQHHPQYVGYQMHHPSQSIRPSSGATANYAYEYVEPPQAQMYYTRPMAPQMTAQYQTVTSSPMVMLSGNASQVPTENIKQQNNNSHQ